MKEALQAPWGKEKEREREKRENVEKTPKMTL